MVRIILFFFLFQLGNTSGQELECDMASLVSHHYATNGDVRLHYVAIGEGPLVLFLHGFPEYWYTWRHQMEALKGDFKVVAMDLRGYNLSDAPAAVSAYKMPVLLDDVETVIKHCGSEKAVIIGHDWGGAIAWQLAIQRPYLVHKLIVCNATHPSPSAAHAYQELKKNGNQSYMDDFRKKTSDDMPVSWLTGWVQDEEARPFFEDAMRRSSVDGMLNYYRANISTKEERAIWLEKPFEQSTDHVSVPTLLIFGTEDRYTSKKGLNNTWDFIDNRFTLVTLPGVGHFVQEEAFNEVNQAILNYLVSNHDQDNKPHSLSWLQGSWQLKEKPYVEERWTRKGSTLHGVGVQIRNNEEVVSEKMTITKIGDEVFYLAHVQGSEWPVAFKLINEGNKQVVFENPIHDFPQRILYQLNGDQQLSAQISDIQDRNKIEFNFIKK